MLYGILTYQYENVDYETLVADAVLRRA